jgi:hypothetical protein
MKLTHIVIVFAALVFLASSSITAEPPADALKLRFVAASEAYEAVKQQLGASAASAVTMIDLRANALGIDSGHSDAPKVRDLVAKLDQRQTTVKVAATIKRIVLATPTAPERGEVIARPTLIGAANEPMKLRFSTSETDALEVEFVVSVNPEAP